MIDLSDVAISRLRATDAPAVLDLNQRFEAETAALDPPRLEALLAASSHALALRHPELGLCGFLIACDQASAYAGENFRWFRARFDRFVYVDRIVIAPSCQGRGLGRRLYAPLLAGGPPVACEVHLAPPNPGSLAFHDRLGFRRVGRGRTAEGVDVAYLMARRR